MTEQHFIDMIVRNLPAGTVFDNPGGGTSSVLSVSRDIIEYQRGNSKIRVRLRDLFTAYEKFQGLAVTSIDLGHAWPEIFDSHARPGGHSCNCTFLYSLLQHLGLAGPTSGRGVRGDPFRVHFYPSKGRP